MLKHIYIIMIIDYYWNNILLASIQDGCQRGSENCIAYVMRKMKIPIITNLS